MLKTYIFTDNDSPIPENVHADHFINTFCADTHYSQTMWKERLIHLDKDCAVRWLENMTSSWKVKKGILIKKEIIKTCS
ncbi:uncharacterized protein [Mytilus edulis]|uniref:uncharacterized protein isoform X3 n=1 Tax=Mytilus edulis TaxID=6550 RepID=UPI0039EF4D62